MYTAVKWLEYCIYCTEEKTINKSINQQKYVYRLKHCVTFRDVQQEPSLFNSHKSQNLCFRLLEAEYVSISVNHLF